MNIYKHVVMAALFATVIPTLYGTSYVEAGKFCYEKGRFKNALSMFEGCIRQREKLTHSELSEIFNLRGNIYHKGNHNVAADASKALTNYQEALEYTQKALDDTWQLFAKSREATLIMYKNAARENLIIDPSEFDFAMDDLIASSDRAQSTIALGKEYQRLSSLANQLEQVIYTLQQQLSN